MNCKLCGGSLNEDNATFVKSMVPFVKRGEVGRLSGFAVHNRIQSGVCWVCNRLRLSAQREAKEECVDV